MFEVVATPRWSVGVRSCVESLRGSDVAWDSLSATRQQRSIFRFSAADVCLADLSTICLLINH